MTDVSETLLETFEECPICERNMGREDIKIGDSDITLNCTCGWSIQVKDDQINLLFK